MKSLLLRISSGEISLDEGRFSKYENDKRTIDELKIASIRLLTSSVIALRSILSCGALDSAYISKDSMNAFL